MGSSLIFGVAGAWGFASRFSRMLRPHRALASRAAPCLTTTAFYCGLGIPLAIRKNIGYSVPEAQPLYNFREYNGYTMGIAGEKKD